MTTIHFIVLLLVGSTPLIWSNNPILLSILLTSHLYIVSLHTFIRLNGGDLHCTLNFLLSLSSLPPLKAPYTYNPDLFSPNLHYVLKGRTEWNDTFCILIVLRVSKITNYTYTTYTHLNRENMPEDPIKHLCKYKKHTALVDTTVSLLTNHTKLYQK